MSRRHVLSQRSASASGRSGPRSRPSRSRRAAGPIVELGEAAIVVQSSEGRLACRVPEEKQAKLEGLKLGDKVKIACAGGMLVGLERHHPSDKPAGEEARIHGAIVSLRARL